MNLKSFHVIFIACATALAFLFGAWLLGSQTLAGTSRQVAAFAALHPRLEIDIRATDRVVDMLSDFARTKGELSS